MWFFLKVGVGFDSQECLLATQDFSYFSFFSIVLMLSNFYRHLSSKLIFSSYKYSPAMVIHKTVWIQEVVKRQPPSMVYFSSTRTAQKNLLKRKKRFKHFQDVCCSVLYLAQLADLVSLTVAFLSLFQTIRQVINKRCMGFSLLCVFFSQWGGRGITGCQVKRYRHSVRDGSQLLLVRHPPAALKHKKKVAHVYNHVSGKKVKEMDGNYSMEDCEQK